MEEVIKEAVAQLSEEEEEGEEEPVNQLRQLSKLSADLNKQIQEMKTNQH